MNTFIRIYSPKYLLSIMAFIQKCARRLVKKSYL